MSAKGNGRSLIEKEEMNAVPRMPTHDKTRYLVAKEEEMEAVVRMSANSNGRCITQKEEEMNAVPSHHKS